MLQHTERGALREDGVGDDEREEQEGDDFVQSFQGHDSERSVHTLHMPVRVPMVKAMHPSRAYRLRSSQRRQLE